jgi:hypothetical protein
VVVVVSLWSMDISDTSLMRFSSTAEWPDETTYFFGGVALIKSLLLAVFL